MVIKTQTTRQVLTALRELINALDRRVRRAGREGEIRIGKDAAELRREAVRRIEALQRDVYDWALADAIMTDDGNPTQGVAERCRSGRGGQHA
jgi:hypothetical protein